MMAALLVPTLSLSVRWWMLLRGHGFQARLGQIFFVTYAGAFFNNFLPGSVGGDRRLSGRRRSLYLLPKRLNRASSKCLVKGFDQVRNANSGP